MINILWVTIDRSNRVARIFDPLREEVEKIANVDVVMKKLPSVAGQYQQAIVNGTLKERPLLNIKKASEYDYVFCDAPFAFTQEPWSKIKTRKAILFEDQHGANIEFSKQYKSKGFNIFFTRYKNILQLHPHLNNVRVCWLPHSIDTEIFHDYKRNKNIGALMVGRITRSVYPIRFAVDRYLHKQNFYKRYNRPGETFEGNKRYPSGKDYAKLINSSRIAFTCSSIYKYPVLKFFEIPGCNTALFSDYNKELKALGFIPDTNMVEIKKKQNYITLINEWFQKKDELLELTKNGYDLIHSRHTAKKRAEDFLNLLEG